jgi:hypothetical protein
MKFCRAHNREATHLNRSGKHCCDPRLGGILLSCDVVDKEQEQTLNDAVQTVQHFLRSIGAPVPDASNETFRRRVDRECFIGFYE